MNNQVRTVFFGSPELAVPALNSLAEHDQVRLVGVVTQPPRVAGRGGKKHKSEQNIKIKPRYRPCAVHREAERLGLPWLGPGELERTIVGKQLEQWGMELGVVCAYGRLLPGWVLEMAKLGMFNLHFSLLPRWRGASPMQAALLAGDSETGVSLQRMQKKLDAGLVVATAREKISKEDDVLVLGTRLSQRAAGLLSEMIPKLTTGTAGGFQQCEGEVTWCKRLKKEDGWIDFSREDTQGILRKMRAFKSWPGCSGWIEGRRLFFLAMEEVKPPMEAMGVLHADGCVRALSGGVRLLRVQLEGADPLDWEEFVRGRSNWIGKSFLSRVEWGQFLSSR